MNRTSGNLAKAASLLEKALALAPRSRIIRHSLAELHIRKGDVARNDLEKVHAISEAERICQDLKRDAEDSYPHSTLVKAGLARLRRAVESDEVMKEEDVEGTIKAVEKDLEDGLRRFPGDSHLLGLEAELAELLCESERFSTALKQSFAKNPRNGYVAWQLAKLHERRGQIEDAQRVLKDALDANRANTRLHLAYGKLLMRHNVGTNDDLIFHFHHSFTPGDSNYEAQLLYGRQLFVGGKLDEARQVFRSLKRVRLPNSVKRRHLYPLDGDFSGMVERSEAWYCLIRRDGDGAIVSFDEDDSGDLEWRDLSRHSRVTFRIAFTMFGPEAFDVKLV
jgi:tetratricopeptide (TPR) repeat protein